MELEPEQVLQIGDRQYRVRPHPAALNTSMKMAYVQEGAKGQTYQLEDVTPGSLGTLYALKVLHAEYRTPRMIGATKRIQVHARLPGLEVCERLCLTKSAFRNLIGEYPELEYAILMPWMDGLLWSEYIIQRTPLTPRESLLLATHIARILWGLESRGIAHTDIAGNNVIIAMRPEASSMSASLVDVEDLHALGWSRPEHVSYGTAGYQHREGRQLGQWRAEGDRFAGAVLLAEMLSWSDPTLRDRLNPGSERVFEDDDLQNPTSEAYHLVRDMLRNIAPNLAALFDEAWLSPTLAACPPLSAWYDILRRLAPTSEAQLPQAIRGVIERWDPVELDTPTSIQRYQWPQALADPLIPLMIGTIIVCLVILAFVLLL